MVPNIQSSSLPSLQPSTIQLSMIDELRRQDTLAMQTTDDGSSNKPAVSNDMESPSGSSGDGGADPKHSSTTSTGDVSAAGEKSSKGTIPIYGPSTTALEAAFEERLRKKLMDGTHYTTSKEQQTPLKVDSETGQKNYHQIVNRCQSIDTSTSNLEERLRRKLDEEPRRRTFNGAAEQPFSKRLKNKLDASEGTANAEAPSKRDDESGTNTKDFDGSDGADSQSSHSLNASEPKGIEDNISRDDGRSSASESFEARIFRKMSDGDGKSYGDRSESFEKPSSHSASVGAKSGDYAEEEAGNLQRQNSDSKSLDLYQQKNNHNVDSLFSQKDQENSVVSSCCLDKKEHLEDVASSIGDNEFDALEDGVLNAHVQVSSKEPTALAGSKTDSAYHRILGSLSTKRFLQATLVPDEEEGDVIEAEPLGLVEQKWRLLAIPVALALSLLAILLSLTLTGVIDVNGDEPMENKQQTLAPTYDPRSSIEIIRERRYLMCGLQTYQIESQGFNWDLCRSVAAVVLGNPDSIKAVVITNANRWEKLNDRLIDVLLNGDTHTIERQTKEPSTGVGFTFSSVYNYDGMVFYGNPDFVKCAEEFKRYDECSTLKICVPGSTTHYSFAKKAFPLDFIVVASNLEEITEMLFNGTCNVATYDKSTILSIASSEKFIDKNYVIGSKLWTKEPLAMVTRNSDREFSDTVNWVLQALIYGEEHGLVKDSTLCQNSTDWDFTNTQDLDFMNAVYCVGNYGEIFDEDLSNGGMNQINNGTGGLLYAIPFGNLEKENDVDPSGTLANIRTKGTLNCGVLVPGDFAGNVTNSTGLVGMGVEYCGALAAALFVGKYDSANLIPYEESNMNSSYVALANGDIDVLVGARIHKKFDFEQPPSLEGAHFSTPYYYGNGYNTTNQKSFFAIASSEDDPLFSSFVDTIVFATFYAEDNDIDREKSREMPLVSVFGDDVSWALIDAIFYSGRYDEIFAKNFGSNGESEAHRGGNALNGGGPMLLPLPGLG